MTSLNLNATWDGTVDVNGESVLVHNAICQKRDVRDEDYQPSADAVRTAQAAVDQAYQRAVAIEETAEWEREAE